MSIASKSSSDQFDVVVVGGGIIGLGVASALVSRKKRVLLIEKGACHSATSDNSHRIIHGGLRYLQTFDLPRLRSSLRAQEICLEKYSDAISSLECFLPIPNRGLKRPFILNLAGALYSLVTKSFPHVSQRARVIAGDSVARLHPLLSRFQEDKVFHWIDGSLHSPEKLTSRVAEEIVQGGGSIWENTTVDSIEEIDREYEFTLTGIHDSVSSRSVVLALGPWFGSLGSQIFTQKKKKIDEGMEWAKAFNLVLSYDVTGDKAVGVTEKSGRVLFFTPRQNNQSAIGTWYSPIRSEKQLSRPEVSEEEIARAISEMNLALGASQASSNGLENEVRIKLDDVERVESGVLPMKGMRDGEPVLYGSEEIFSHDGLFEVLSTKYTTFPVVGEKVSRLVDEYLKRIN